MSRERGENKSVARVRRPPHFCSVFKCKYLRAIRWRITVGLAIDKTSFLDIYAVVEFQVLRVYDLKVEQNKDFTSRAKVRLLENVFKLFAKIENEKSLHCRFLRIVRFLGR